MKENLWNWWGEKERKRMEITAMKKKHMEEWGTAEERIDANVFPPYNIWLYKGIIVMLTAKLVESKIP